MTKPLSRSDLLIATTHEAALRALAGLYAVSYGNAQRHFGEAGMNG